MFESQEVDSPSALVTISNGSLVGSYDMTVVDFSGTIATFEGVVPSSSSSAGSTTSTTLSTLLGESISTIDIVPIPLGSTIKPSNGENLFLFNEGEGYVGNVFVRMEGWLEELKGGKQEIGGSARSPMRE